MNLNTLAVQHLLCTHTSARFKTVLDHNRRCEWVNTISERMQEGSGLEVASNQIKKDLKTVVLT